MDIEIKIHCQDISDLKMHLSIIREQTLFALKNNTEDKKDFSISYEGVGSKHVIEMSLD